MADTHRTAAQPSVPSGAVFHELSRPKVSESFIRSLDQDGVSRETIKSIERENARREQA
jgi:predicted metal-dependent phosphotriesterase family hydrolase